MGDDWLSGNPVEINREIVYNEQEFPLHYAVIKDLASRVKELLDGGSNVNHRDKVTSHTPCWREREKREKGEKREERRKR